MENEKSIPKFAIEIQDNNGSFLLGGNLNINLKTESYMCIYLGFKTLVIGFVYNYD
jgi:hypothetical protein